MYTCEWRGLELCSRRISCFHAFWCFPRPILAVFHTANVFLSEYYRVSCISMHDACMHSCECLHYSCKFSTHAGSLSSGLFAGCLGRAQIQRCVYRLWVYQLAEAAPRIGGHHSGPLPHTSQQVLGENWNLQEVSKIHPWTGTYVFWYVIHSSVISS